jgi:hypothetical protein
MKIIIRYKVVAIQKKMDFVCSRFRASLFLQLKLLNRFNDQKLWFGIDRLELFRIHSLKLFQYSNYFVSMSKRCVNLSDLLPGVGSGSREAHGRRELRHVHAQRLEGEVW